MYIDTFTYDSKLFDPQNVAVNNENMESPFLQVCISFLYPNFDTWPYSHHHRYSSKAMTTPRLSIPDHPWHPHRLHLPGPGNGHKKTSISVGVKT